MRVFLPVILLVLILCFIGVQPAANHTEAVNAGIVIPSAVNTGTIYTHEPAPMGIADYGIGPRGEPYEYNTTSFMGVASVDSLSTYNSSLNYSSYYGGPYGMTFQLNAVLVAVSGGASYAYWSQNVAFINTSSNRVRFEDNVWNYTSEGAEMYNSTVSGSGKIENFSGGDYYYDFASKSLPGNNMELSYPSTVELRMNATVVSGHPEIVFSYNSGQGWQVYDSAVIKFLNTSGTPEFRVDGFTYSPVGTYYDAELIMGGPAGGSHTGIVSSSVLFQLDYWNGHNYQMITNAFNFGSNTQEGIYGAGDSGIYSKSNGSLYAKITAGNSTLGQIYNSGDIGILNVTSNVPSGYLMINGTAYNFTGEDVNVTLYPGEYAFQLYTSSNVLVASGTLNLSGGEYLPMVITGSYAVTFYETGLSPGTSWSVTLNGTTESSTTGMIIFMVSNGTYSYRVNPVPGYTALNDSGNMSVVGENVEYNVTFKAEKGAPVNLALLIGTFAAILVIAVVLSVFLRRKAGR
ncbi:MAG: thermopsin [Thermoplasmatales archaeon]|nr:thermopsin [Thermoplasmatales archaeon]MCW6170148.1 thermopsin [Thermoplasmatales archaeon]